MIFEALLAIGTVRGFVAIYERGFRFFFRVYQYLLNIHGITRFIL